MNATLMLLQKSVAIGLILRSRVKAYGMKMRRGCTLQPATMKLVYKQAIKTKEVFSKFLACEQETDTVVLLNLVRSLRAISPFLWPS